MASNEISKKLFLLGITIYALLGFLGCSTKMATFQEDGYAKTFPVLKKGMSGVYIWRPDIIFASGAKRSIYIDEQEIGQSARGVYFYKQIPYGKHLISTMSEFGRNHLDIYMKSKRNYCIRQYLRLGVFGAGANVELLDFNKCKEVIPKLRRAKDAKVLIDGKSY